MWTFKSLTVSDNVFKFTLYANDNQLSFDDVILGWSENSDFRKFYISILKQSPFEAFFWENLPVTLSTISQSYEFVLVNSPQLVRVKADLSAFQEKLTSASQGQSVVAFENLGRDAELIVPRPVNPQSDYAHFASFLRNAHEDQIRELFVLLAKSLRNRINNQPTWVSTSGLGVYWLHVRLDSRPKYYSYQPYRQYGSK